MGDDAAFFQAILANPEDDALRLVYADWLEERGDPRGEFLRATVTIEALLWRDDPQASTRARLQRVRDIARLKARLRELHALLDPCWIAALHRGWIEHCNIPDAVCPKRWWKLREVIGSPWVRACSDCQRRVYYCQSVKQVDDHSLAGHPVVMAWALKRE